MLTTAELTAIRELENSWMTSTGIIYRPSEVRDPMGGLTTTYAILGTISLDVWQANRSPNEDVEFEVTAINEWYLTVPYNTDVTEKDLCEVNSRTFEILSVPKGQSLNTALRCRARTYNQESRI